MGTVRHLITRWGFRADTSAVDRFNRSILTTRGSIMGSVGGLYAMKRAFSGMIRIADEFESNKLIFDAFAKTTEESAKNLKDVYDYIRRMPVDMKSVLMISQKVQTHGLQELGLMEVVETIGNLTPAFGRDPRRIQDLLKAISDIYSAGKLMGSEVRQLLNVSLPILAEMRKNLGDGYVENFKKMMQRGEITFELFWSEFKKLAGPGSKYEALLLDKLETFAGLRILLMNRIKLLLGEASKELLPNFKRITKELLAFVEANESLIKSNVVSYMKAFGKIFMDIKLGLQAVNTALSPAVLLMGGWGEVIRKAYQALLIFLGYKGLKGLGKVGVKVYGTLKSIARIVRVVAKVFRMRGAISAFRLLATLLTAVSAKFVLIGAAITGIMLVIEDIVHFFKGNDSAIGRFWNRFTGDAKQGEKKSWYQTIRDDTRQKLMQAYPNYKPMGSQSNVKINEVNITVPENTPTKEMPAIISQGFKEAINGMMKQSVNNNTTTVLA